MTDTDNEAVYEQTRAQVEALRATDARSPIAVRMGQSQRDAIEAHVRNVSGQADVGPLISFHGLEVRSSKKADHVVLLWAEGDDPEPIEAGPEIPPAPPASPPQPGSEISDAPNPEAPPSA